MVGRLTNGVRNIARRTRGDAGRAHNHFVRPRQDVDGASPTLNELTGRSRFGYDVAFGPISDCRVLERSRLKLPSDDGQPSKHIDERVITPLPTRKRSERCRLIDGTADSARDPVLALGTKLSMQMTLEWWNFEEFVVRHFIHWLAVAGLCIALTYYARLALGGLKRYRSSGASVAQRVQQ